MDPADYGALPGAEFITRGLDDLRRGEESVEALLVLIGAPKLQSLGFDVPAHKLSVSPEHRLYDVLSAEDGHTAHSRYNALVRRLVSFERAMACASA